MFFVDQDLEGLSDNDLSSGRKSDPEVRMDLGHHTQGGHQGTGSDPEARGGHTRMDSGHHTQSGYHGTGSDLEAGGGHHGTGSDPEAGGGHHGTGSDPEAGGGHTRMDSGRRAQGGHHGTGSDLGGGIDTGNDNKTATLGTQNAISN